MSKRSLSVKDIDPEVDIFLGETSVQIRSFHAAYPSVHLVKSYMLNSDEEEKEGNFYHIFEYKAGTAVTNYGLKEYRQVEKFIDVSDYWSIFYRDPNPVYNLLPVSKESRTRSHSVKL